MVLRGEKTEFPTTLANMSNFNQTTYDQRRTSRWPLPQDYDDEQVFNKRVDTSRPTTGHEVQRIDSATMPPMGEFKFGPQSPVSESRFDNSPTDARFAPDAKDVAYRRDERATTQVVGTTNLYEHGELRLIPVSSGRVRPRSQRDMLTHLLLDADPRS